MTISSDTCVTCKVRNCSILKPCTITTLSALSTFKTAREFQKGEFIFEEGAPVKGVYFIKKGVVKIEKKAANGRSLILKIGGRGGIIGHRGHDHLNVQNCTATALSDVVCCFIPMNFFKEILKSAPDLERQLYEEYLNDLKQIEQRSLGLAYKNVREKVAEVLLLIAEIYGYTLQSRGFNIDLSRQDFADLTGTTKEQVSAALKEFERLSYLRYSGKRFYHIDLAMLKSISGNY